MRHVLLTLVLVASAFEIRDAAQAPPPAAMAGAVQFAANAGTLGAIPDRPALNCGPETGGVRDVTFTVTGMPASAPSSVKVEMTFNVPHTWAGDVEVRLIAPNATAFPIFGRTGTSSTDASCGDGSDLTGPYAFSDDAAAPPSGGWWQAATAANDTTSIASGTYRTTGVGAGGATNPQPPTALTAAFAGIPDANGTWTLRFTDHGHNDTGSIGAATLTLGGPVVRPTPFDYDGDHKSDAAITRAENGAKMWYVRRSSDLGLTALAWGLTTDVPVAGDFDGDGRIDVGVWRSGSPATFYVRQSSDGNLLAQQWGISGDNTQTLGDYDGDGKDDFAVRRCPGGGQCTYYVRKSSDGSLLSMPWGLGVDGRPSPGDYDGDGRADFGARNPDPGAGTTNIFYLQQSTAGFAAIPWGLKNDNSVRGDYDGDGKDDLVVIRVQPPNYYFYVRRSSDQSLFAVPWGTSDLGCAGDYDGDGKADLCVYRWAGTATTFYIRQSSNGSLLAIPWGLTGDIPASQHWVY